MTRLNKRQLRLIRSRIGEENLVCSTCDESMGVEEELMEKLGSHEVGLHAYCFSGHESKTVTLNQRDLASIGKQVYRQR